MVADGSCSRCWNDEETLVHLFRECDFARDCWRTCLSARNFQASSHAPFLSWVEANCSSKEKLPDNTWWEIKFPYMLWTIWKARNEWVFSRTMMSAGEVSKRAHILAFEAGNLLVKKNVITGEGPRWIGWTPPPIGRFKLNTDGAKKAGTGLASAGGLIRDHLGRWVIGFSAKIGRTDSFTAELWGLREGLKLVRSKGFRDVDVELDSEAVVKTLDKDIGRDHGTATLILDCKKLLSCGGFGKVSHVLREGNRCANFLANKGQVGVWGTSILVHPPEDIDDLIKADAVGALTQRVRR